MTKNTTTSTIATVQVIFASGRVLSMVKSCSGLVQTPCIERSAIAAVKASNAAQMALCGDGQHFVSLDKEIRTMREAGKDMQDKYKEMSKGGMAINEVEC